MPGRGGQEVKAVLYMGDSSVVVRDGLSLVWLVENSQRYGESSGGQTKCEQKHSDSSG